MLLLPPLFLQLTMVRLSDCLAAKINELAPISRQPSPAPPTSAYRCAGLTDLPTD